MANWCMNYITFSGKKEEVNNLKVELDSMITVYDGHTGLIPSGFIEPIETSDYIFDLEIVDVSEDRLTVHYKTKWSVSTSVLQHLATKFNVEFQGTCMEEQNRTDTCGFVFGARDGNDEVVVVSRVLCDCGLDVDYMVEDRSYFSDEFLDDTATSLAKVLFDAFKEAVEDAKCRNEEAI